MDLATLIKTSGVDPRKIWYKLHNAVIVWQTRRKELFNEADTVLKEINLDLVNQLFPPSQR
jgi:hypothetical protein